jgi:hypothetical protein
MNAFDRDPTTTPICFTRLEVNEHRFVSESDGDTDGVVIAHRFDTPPKHGRLKQESLRARMPYLIDIESWRLPYLESDQDDSFGSDVETAIAGAVPLPLSTDLLLDPGRSQALVRTAATVQSGAEVSFAPDFQFAAIDDPAFQVNRACLRQLRELAPREKLGAWIHISLETMRSGILPYVADIYARELPTGTILVLTVSDIRPTLPPEDLAIYFYALRAFESAGFRVIVDRASVVSVPAVAAFASGCMLGNRIYRTAPSSPIFENDYNPKMRLRYFDGERVRTLKREVARKRFERGVLACRSSNCRAATATSRKRLYELRFHAAHGMRNAIRDARQEGSRALQRRWRDAELKHLRGFAQALELVEARSEEA